MSLNHLLFFDTFSHETTEATQLDLVQFPRAVQVSEIRVIPLGARVKADFPGGVRLGATNPSQFNVEFFVNDLSKRGAATFESIGTLQYSQHANIVLDFEKKQSTDGLLLRGNYNTVTLAVYGSLTKVHREPSPPKEKVRVEPPPGKVNTHERIRNWLEDTKRKQNDYDVNPSEEDPGQVWDVKGPRSPDPPKSWDGLSSSKAKDTKKSKNRSSSRERSFEKGDRGKRETSRERMERELDRGCFGQIDDEDEEEFERNEPGIDLEKNNDGQKLEKVEKEISQENREQYSEEDIGFESHNRGTKSVDVWEMRSELSDRSSRHPRTPIDPVQISDEAPLCDPLSSIPRDPRRGACSSQYQDIQTSPINPAFRDRDWDRDHERELERRSSERRSREIESVNRESSKERDLSRDLTRGSSEVSSRGAGAQIIPPHIPTEEMEAISDDEDIPNIPMDEERFTQPTSSDVEPVLDEQPAVVEEVAVERFVYEEIMSDEDDLPEYQYEDYLYEEWEDWIKPFNPHDLVEVPPLLFLNPPHFTEYEREKWRADAFEEKDSLLSDKLSSLLLNTPLPTISIAGNDGTNSDAIADGETWVQAGEAVCQSLPKAIVHVMLKEETLTKLFQWVRIGLNFDLAFNQQQPIFKIRHMKCGIRLAYSLLQCSSGISTELLQHDVLDKLFDLIAQPHMALSIKLLIIRTIDATLSTSEGLQYFVYARKEDKKSAYERTLELLSCSQQSRAKFAISAIIRKIHLMEVCEKLHADAIALVNFFPPLENKSEDTPKEIKVNKTEVKVQNGIEESEANDMKEENVQLAQSLPPTSVTPPSLIFPNLPLTLLQSILSCLKTILRDYTHAKQLFVQPNRWLPGSNLFSLPKLAYDPYPQIYLIFEQARMLDTLALLLSTPCIMQYSPILGNLKNLMELLGSSHHGLTYLAWQRKQTTLIVKSLLQYGSDISEGATSSSLYHFGIELVYKIHILHQLDCLAQLENLGTKEIKKEKGEESLSSIDYSQAIVHLNCLQSLLVCGTGRHSVVEVLGMPQFTKILFPYLRIDMSDDQDAKPNKCACFGYAVDLVVTTVKLCEKPDLLEKVSDPLFTIISMDEKEEAKLEEYVKLWELLPYISVSKNSDFFTYDHIPTLISIVQENMDRIEKHPGELVASLRILCYLAIPAYPIPDVCSEDHNNELIEELKYKYATIQLFSQDLYTNLINILSRIFSNYHQPFLHSSSFVGMEAGLLLTLVKPTLLLLKNILNHVVKARNTDFKDLSAVVPLAQMYVLLDVFPSSSNYFTKGQALQREIINILLCYTQVVYNAGMEEDLSKSLWAQMLAEVLKYLLNAPHTIISMITLLTELLPLPLPIHTLIPFTKEESEMAIQLRKLWSVHLYSLAPTINDVIHRLGFATHPLLTHSLRRMCVALSDLSAPMSLVVARAILDLLLQTHRLDQRRRDDALASSVTCSLQTTRVLNTLASLVSHAPTKAAVLHLLRGGTHAPLTLAKSDEKYCSLMGLWCEILVFESSLPSYSHAKDCLLSVLAYLCDHDDIMQDSHIDTNTPLDHVEIGGIPHKDLLIPIIEALVEIIKNSLSTPSNVQQSFKILSKLLKSGYAFYYVKSIMDKKKGCLVNLMNLMAKSFVTEDLECNLMLREFLDFCNNLLCSENELKSSISIQELATYLGWKDKKSDVSEPLKEPIEPIKKDPDAEKADDVETEPGQIDDREEVNEESNKDERKKDFLVYDNIHPLKVLEQIVASSGPESEIQEHLYGEVSQLISKLENFSLSIEQVALEEPPPPGNFPSLHSCFSNRMVWTTNSGHEDMLEWMMPPPWSEGEEIEGVSVNLFDTCRRYAGNFDIMGSINKLIKGQSSFTLSPAKIVQMQPKFKQNNASTQPDSRGRPYVSPMRGRGFNRGMNLRIDPFRSRPPNTSRPPSLHVDDFVALESTGHQPTGPTGYNKISFGRGKMMLDSMRGRIAMRPRGPDNRGGRFFHRPPYRGDVRGMVRGMGMVMGRPCWGFRGDVHRANFRRPPPQLPPRFIRGRPFIRPDRFMPPKFIERGPRGVGGGRHHRGFR